MPYTVYLFNRYGLIHIIVSDDLEVTILSNGTSQVGTPHQLVCQTGGSSSHLVGTLTYQWTSTCPGQCFVLGHANEAVVSTQYLKAVDAGIHTCTVTDSVGNRGNASIEIVTTGKQILYHKIIPSDRSPSPFSLSATTHGHFIAVL